MTNHDYAAPLSPERRKSIWSRFTRSVQLTVDWNSAPPLTAGLRERFPDLLRGGTPVQDPPPVPAIPDALRTGFRAAESTRVDGVRGGDPPESSQQGASQRNGRRQRSTHRVSNGGPGLDRIVTQQADRLPNGEREAKQPCPSPIRSRSPLWNQDLYEAPRPAPVHNASSTTTRTRQQQQQQQQRSTGEVVYHRNAHGQLISVAHLAHPSSRTNSIRRRPVQSSLRNQISQDESPSRSVSSNHTPTAGYVEGVGNFSHFPIYSFLPSTTPHALPHPPPRSSSAARYIHTQAQAQNSPTSTSSTPAHRTHSTSRSPHPTLAELQASSPRPTTAELEGSLSYSPPSFPHIPFPHPPCPPFAYPASTHTGSTTSLSTFSNPNPSSPPLGRLKSKLIGLQRRISEQKRCWKTKLMRAGRGVKKHTRFLWDKEDHTVRIACARLDVWCLGGPAVGCTCGVCVEKRGEGEVATCVAHGVPYERWMERGGEV